MILLTEANTLLLRIYLPAGRYYLPFSRPRERVRSRWEHSGDDLLEQANKYLHVKELSLIHI